MMTYDTTAHHSSIGDDFKMSAMFWLCSGYVFGYVLVMFCVCFGYVLAVFWMCSGHVLAMFWDVLESFLDARPNLLSPLAAPRSRFHGRLLRQRDEMTRKPLMGKGFGETGEADGLTCWTLLGRLMGEAGRLTC